MAGTIHVKTGSLEGIGEYGQAIFQVFFTFRRIETVADKDSCLGCAKYRPRNLGTAESIVGFQRPLKYSLNQGPKLVRKGVPANTPNPENPMKQANRCFSGP
jgi:hypothetical protein